MQDLRGFPSNNPPLSACEKESSIFPRRAPGTSAASREATTWGSDVELEEMESEQTGLAFSLPPSPERVRATSPVEFVHDFLFPSPRARDTVSKPGTWRHVPSLKGGSCHFQRSASRDLQILEAAIFLPPY